MMQGTLVGYFSRMRFDSCSRCSKVNLVVKLIFFFVCGEEKKKLEECWFSHHRRSRCVSMERITSKSGNLRGAWDFSSRGGRVGVVSAVESVALLACA